MFYIVFEKIKSLIKKFNFEYYYLVSKENSCIIKIIYIFHIIEILLYKNYVINLNINIYIFIMYFKI